MDGQTKKLSEGAMMCAVLGVLFFINRQVAGMIDTAAYWLYTFPVLLYTARYGAKAALGPAFCTLLLAYFLSGFTTLFYMLSVNICALFYGEGIRKKWRNGRLLSGLLFITFLSYLVATWLLAGIFGYDLKEDSELLRLLFPFLPAARCTGALATVFIALLLSVLQSFCLHVCAKELLHRLRIETLPSKSLLQLSLPRWLGYIIISIWLLYFSGNVIELNHGADRILLFLYLLSVLLAAVYGALTLSLWLLQRHRRFLALFVIVGVMLPYVQMVLALLGMADMLLDIRKRMLEQWKRGVLHGSSGKS